MPTSPRDLTDGTGGYLTTRPVVGPSGPMKGIGPYARRKPLPSIVPRPSSIGVPSTPVPGCARSTLSKQERAPHPSRLTACHLPRGGRLPPAGASYRRGRFLTFPWGKVLTSGGRGAVPGWFWVPPHTRQGFALPPSPRRGFFPSSVTPYGVPPSPQGKARYRRGRFLTFPLAFQTFFPFTPFTNPLLCCKIGSSSQKLWEVWS